MRVLIVALISSLSTVAAIFLVMMGLDYMDPDIGRGLHPLIAFPVATLAIVAAGVLAVMCMYVERIEIHDAQDDDLMVKRY